MSNCKPIKIVSGRLDMLLRSLYQHQWELRGRKFPDEVYRQLRQAEEAANEYMRTSSWIASYPHAGQNVKVDIGNGLQDFHVEDWWMRVGGGSWRSMTLRNPACAVYQDRVERRNLDPDDDVLYGKIGKLGYLIHISEIVLHDIDETLYERERFKRAERWRLIDPFQHYTESDNITFNSGE